MEAHAVSFRRENGAVVQCQKQSAAVMEYIAALMDTLAMSLLEPVVEEAKVYLC